MRKLVFALTAGALSVLGDVRPADACGGCFVPPAERTVVTDHRMALSISTQQTVLWDQIRYSGDPKEFAWVLPVRDGAQIEVANDEFFAALDASTQPVTYGPNSFGGGLGCGLTGCSSEESAASDAPGPGEVQVLRQSVVGPYETVTLRATDDDALTKWLTSHAYAIPPSIEPTIKAYVDERFDFIALRLRPQCSERSMRPVRVITQGADPTLPLRMVAAGVGARVGITLYVIAEGRYEPQSFPVELLDDDKLRWNRIENRSNYEALSQETMAKANGRTWLTETADLTRIPIGRWSNSANRTPTPFLADAYFLQCPSRGGVGASSSSNGSSPSGSFTPCPQAAPPNADQNQTPATTDAGWSTPDASTPDASTPDASTPDASTSDASTSDASTPDASTPTAPPPRSSAAPPLAPYDCAQLDDLDVALRGMHREDVWVTRLRAVLPVDALSVGDLKLRPVQRQLAVSNLHYAAYYEDEDAPARGGCGSAPKEHRAYGSWVLGIMASIFAVALVRRRRRR